MTKISKPTKRPLDPRFSSGPCAKPPTWKTSSLSNAPLGRSHRRGAAKKKIESAIEQTREVLNIPSDYKIAMVPGSNTGAFEIALWSLLGYRKVTVLVWESFGRSWAADISSQLKLSPVILEADYGALPKLEEIDFTSDLVFVWNGTTSGVQIPDGNFIPNKRVGLTICDATSAAFAVELPWNKLDAVTFSWQKVLGGEAAHGMLVLSPNAIDRLNNYNPPWPVPKLFSLKRDGKLNEDIFNGFAINTPSILAVEDYLFSLSWFKSIGGLKGMIDLCDRNAGVVHDFVDNNKWICNLAGAVSTRSNTSVCLVFRDERIKDKRAFVKNICERLEIEGVAFDIISHRDAPAGLRIWCGGTVNIENLKLLLPWIKWAFESEIAKLA